MMDLDTPQGFVQRLPGRVGVIDNRQRTDQLTQGRQPLTSLDSHLIGLQPLRSRLKGLAKRRVLFDEGHVDRAVLLARLQQVSQVAGGKP